MALGSSVVETLNGVEGERVSVFLPRPVVEFLDGVIAESDGDDELAFESREEVIRGLLVTMAMGGR